jgi:signal transduction histidine kinase
VETIVRYCTSRYQDCGKFQDICTRNSAAEDVDQANRETPSLQVDKHSGGLMLPLQLDRKTFTAVQHSLRTPLTSITSFSEILLQHPVDDADAQRQFLQVIHDEAERLNHALNVIFSVQESAHSEKPTVNANNESSELLELETPEV